MVKRKRAIGHTIILQKNTQKTKIEQQELHYKPEVNAGASEGLAGPAPLVTPIWKTRFPFLTVQIYRQTQALIP